MAILAIVLGCATSGAALAAPKAAAVPSAQALAAAAFAPRPIDPADADPIDRILERQAAQDGGAREFRSKAGELPLRAQDGDVIDALLIRASQVSLSPGGAPLAPQHEDLQRDLRADSYELSLVHRWPGAVSFGAAGLDFDLSPHVRVGADSYGGGTAEAGATLDLSRHLSDIAGERLKAMGVADGGSFGDRGRFYLFAAASGRAVGLNMLKGDQGWNRAGWSTDPTSRLVGDAEVGLGWRKGAIQTSVGYVHREVKGDHMMYGVDPQADSMVAFTFALKRRR